MRRSNARGSLNDLEVSQCCLKIKQLAATLAELQAQNREHALGDALAHIKYAATQAEWRLLELKPLPPLILPPSQGPVSG